MDKKPVAHKLGQTKSIQNRAEKKYRSLFENMLNGFALHKIVLNKENIPIDYTFLEVNKAFEKQTGLNKKDIIGKNVTRVIPGIEKDLFDWIGKYGQVAITGEEISFEQFFADLSRWYRVFAYSPEKGQFATIFMDITRHKEAEQALQKAHDELELRVDERTKTLAQTNEMLTGEIDRRRGVEKSLRERDEYFRAVSQTANDAIITIDHSGTISFWNDGAVNIFGYRAEEIVGQPCTRIIPKRFRARHEAGVAQFNAKTGSKITSEPLEFVGLHKKGYEFFIELSLANWSVGDDYFFTGIIRDITDRKRLEDELKLVQGNLEDLVKKRTSELANKHEELINETTSRLLVYKEKEKLEGQLLQSQKMEAIGTLAGGIAHDFNNILAAVIGYTELVISDLPLGSQNSRDLDQVLKAGHRAKELVQQILTFSRKSDQDFRPLRIQLIAKEVVKLLRSTIPSTIEIKQDIDSNCKNVLADPTQIHQVIMNLCTNAYHAMRKSGGTLSISLQQIEFRNTDKKLALAKGTYLKLGISDTGMGIPKEIQGKIFEPYFTTKSKGEGTGLGLAVVHGIVNSLKGDIRLDNKPGQGTCFQVYLPVAEEENQFIPKKITKPLSRGREKILFVDDDAAIAQMSKVMLVKLGYDVTALVDSMEALEIFKRSETDFDIIITDMTMPKMTGGQLAEQVLAIRPGMPIILCTGFSELINEKQAVKMGICKYLLKPVDNLELSQAVREVLDKNIITKEN
jgi:PAS domain S-box-containing protein